MSGDPNFVTDPRPTNVGNEDRAIAADSQDAAVLGGLAADFLLVPLACVGVSFVGLLNVVYVLAFLCDSFSEASLFVFFGVLASPLNYLIIRGLYSAWVPAWREHLKRKLLITLCYVLASLAGSLDLLTGNEETSGLLFRLLRHVAGA